MPHAAVPDRVQVVVVTWHALPERWRPSTAQTQAGLPHGHC
jgi:hypothetical protein